MPTLRRILLATLVTACAVLVPALPAGGHDEDATLFLGFSLQATGPSTTAGTFVASGAVSDMGTSTVDELAVVPLGRRDGGRLTGRQVFAGAHGTIVTRFRGVARYLSRPHQVGEGRVRIVSGTGAYAGLRGRGEFTIVVVTPPAGNTLIGTEEIEVGDPAR
ncbi:MAG TPA: hypothetical protein VN213_12410 [Solirubrobacteraceae bacterium]|nr:hypothetical protein [Solirubrobacteraceae bacterium]